MLKNLYQNHYIFKIIFTILTTIMGVRVTSGNKANICYAPYILNASWTDSRPDFAVNMTFRKQGSICSETWVNREIAQPIVKLKILQNDNTVYSISTRLCQLQQYTKHISAFQLAFQSALKQGNYSMNCPMKEGYYVLDNIRVGLRNPLMGFLYRPKNNFTMIGGLYEELGNKSVTALTTYKVTFKVVKKSCGESNL